MWADELKWESVAHRDLKTSMAYAHNGQNSR